MHIYKKKAANTKKESKESGKKPELNEHEQEADGNRNLTCEPLYHELAQLGSDSGKELLSRLDSMTIQELEDVRTKYILPYKPYKSKETLVKHIRGFIKSHVVVFDFDHLQNSPVKILMITEKSQMAEELAHVLAQGGKVTECSKELSKVLAQGGKRYGVINTRQDTLIPVYKFEMNFNGYEANVWMTSTLGHIFKQDFRKEDSKKPKHQQIQELFEAEVVDVEPCPWKRIPQMLGEMAKKADSVALWLDYDMEGESICYEVLDCIKDVLKKPPSGDVNDVIYRAKFSSSAEALSAIRNLIKPNHLHHLSTRTKHELDLRISAPFSRYQTDVLRTALPQCNIPNLYFDPCQFPSLNFIVQQYDNVQKYVPKLFSQIYLIVEAGGYEIQVISDPIEDKEIAESIAQKIKEQGECKVVSVDSKYLQNEPPEALNTFEFLKDASRHHGIGPEEAMEAALKLYQMGLITYPRTETTKYSRSVNLCEMKEKLQKVASTFEKSIDWMGSLEENETVYTRGEDKGDHPPIIPTGKTISRKLSKNEKIIYELICRRFFASWMPDQELFTEVVQFEAADLILTRKIEKVFDYGFSVLLPKEKTLTKDVPTSLLKEGLLVKIKNVKVVEEHSTCPILLTEPELIDLMKEHHIGTIAFISGHIADIQTRKYVTIDKKSRTLKPTKLGIQLIRAYRQYVPELVDTSLRTEFEKQIFEIAKGEKEVDEVRQLFLNKYKKQFNQFVNGFSKSSKGFKGCFGLKKSNHEKEGNHGKSATSKGVNIRTTDHGGYLIQSSGKTISRARTQKLLQQLNLK